MKHYLKCFLVLLLLSLATFSYQNVAGQAGLETRVNKADVQFPDGVVFRLEVSSEEVIENVELYYGTSGRTCQPGASRYSFKVDPASQIELDWRWDWKRSGILPPGSEIYWEWEFTTETGYVYRTPKEYTIIEDLRHEWKVVDRGGIVLRWYHGDNMFGNKVHKIAIESLDRLSREMGIRPEGVIQVTIYPTTEDLREALLVSTEWTGGVALSDYDSFLLAVQPHELEWASSIIPHELTHLVVNALFFNCRGAYLPNWLSEGLAEYGENYERPGELDTLITQIADGKLPPLRLLAGEFSAHGDSAGLAYLQSKRVVTFLYEEFGQDHIKLLLETLRSGRTIDQSLEAVYGFDTDGLDQAWRESLGFRPSQKRTIRSLPGVTTATPIPTLSLQILVIEPTPTATNTAVPPSSILAQTKSKADPISTKTTIKATPSPALKDDLQIQGSSPLRLVLGIGAGMFILIAILLYLRSSGGE